MIERDLLVSFIALSLGLLMITSALVNYEKAFQLNTPQYLTQTLGRSGARFVMATIGLFVVSLGLYLVCTPIFGDSRILQDRKSRGPSIPRTDEGLSNSFGERQLGNLTGS